MHLGFARLGPKVQDEVLDMFIRLCKDETPMVRRLAAQNIEHWARLLSDSPQRQKDVIGAFKSFLADDQVQCDICGMSEFDVLWSSTNRVTR